MNSLQIALAGWSKKLGSTGRRTVLLLLTAALLLAGIYLLVRQVFDDSRLFFTNQVLWPLWTSAARRAKAWPENVELLGNPGSGRFPEWMGWKSSRPIRVMQRFAGKIYLGTGDWAENTGPVPIFYFDPGKNKIEIDKTSGNNYKSPDGFVDEEAIDQYRIINGKLVIPGTDPRESWDLGNFYRKEAGGWKKYRTIPQGVHTFDMCKFKNRLFAANGIARPQDSIVHVSDDDGRSWKDAAGTTSGGLNYQAFLLFQFSGDLYATTSSFSILKYDTDRGFKALPLEEVRTFIPGAKPIRLGQFPGCPQELKNVQALSEFICKAVNFNDCLVYIVQTAWPPASRQARLFEAKDHLCREIELPCQCTVRDVKISDDNILYVLCDTKSTNSENYLISVCASRDLNSWTQVCQFNSDTLAESFEILNGDLYFGCSSEGKNVPDTAGDLLRIKSNHLKALP
jgi:hypothetical protein